jgi:hypothetical protein
VGKTSLLILHFTETRSDAKQGFGLLGALSAMRSAFQLSGGAKCPYADSSSMSMSDLSNIGLRFGANVVYLENRRGSIDHAESDLI